MTTSARPHIDPVRVPVPVPVRDPLHSAAWTELRARLRAQARVRGILWFFDTGTRTTVSVCLALALFVSPTSAAPALQVTLAAEQQLARDAHTTITVIVHLPAASADLPLLLTPRVEGSAVELVRGRLMRHDAKPDGPARLHFELPVVARSQGTAILRVTVLTYQCDQTCRRVEATTTAVLEVR